jgi:hypothetical protein
MNTIINPGLAKNVLTVGGSEAPEFMSPDHYCGFDPSCCASGNLVDPDHSDDSNDVAYFSSRGTAESGKRIKPDVVAPAFHTYSGANRVDYLCLTQQIVPAGLTPTPSTTPTPTPRPPEYPSYIRNGLGTSFSTPLVAGFCQVAAVHLAELYSASAPSPSLLKAYAIHSASFLTGNHSGPYDSSGIMTGTSSLPSPHQGFGRTNLDFALDTHDRFTIDQTVVYTSTSSSTVISGEIADGSKPFRAVLVWTDCWAALPADKWDNLVNDLDLYVRHLHAIDENSIAIKQFVGNRFSGGESTHANTIFNPSLSLLRAYADTANNVEAIFIPASALNTGDDIKITIKPWVLDGDAIAQDPEDPGAQDFALVVYNFVED